MLCLVVRISRWSRIGFPANGIGAHHYDVIMTAVQRHVIPLVMRAGLTPGAHPGDLCVSAPTGSGKTLAYVVPIVHVCGETLLRHCTASLVLPCIHYCKTLDYVFPIVHVCGETDPIVPP
jgi:ATP-dependent RNA helicase DDX51/DBP6